MKTWIVLVLISMQGFIFISGNDNLANQNSKQENASHEKLNDDEDEKNIHLEKEKLIQTLNSITEQLSKNDELPTSHDKPDWIPFEETFVSEEKALASSPGTERALNEFLNSYKLENQWRIKETNMMNYKSILANEKYKKAKSLLELSMSDKVLAHILMLEASIEGSDEAKGEVAWAMLFGIHVPQNIELAKDIFEELSEEGDSTGHAGMAFLYSIGLGKPFDHSRSLIHYTIAALGGSSWAKMALGYRYRQGVGVFTSCEKALIFYKLVADEVAEKFQPFGGTIIQRTSIVDESEDYNYKVDIIGTDIKYYHEMQAEKGEITSQVGLGQLYYRGAKGLPRDLQKALRYFQMAASNEHPLAFAYIGKIYLEGGENIDIDLPLAYTYFKKAADLGHAAGEAGLGLMYMKGLYVEMNQQKAIHFFGKSASRGWVESMVELGKIYYLGLFGHKDIFLARKFFMTAAQAGHVLSYYYLGLMTADGIGTMRSCKTAVELFKITSERGKWGGLFMDAYTLYKDKKYNEAFVIYAVLAEIGYAVGQSNAAFILNEYPVDLPLQHTSVFDGDLTDDWIRQRKALQFWSRSAIQGYGRAVVKIGDHHYYGLGTEADFETAAMYYRYSAQQDRNAQAMFNLGYMHEHGLGCEKDTHLARRCYHTAMDWSDDAWFPVGLALMKLNIVETYSSIVSFDWKHVLQLKMLDNMLGPYWDVFAVLFLTCLAIRLVNARLFHGGPIFDFLHWPLFA